MLTDGFDRKREKISLPDNWGMLEWRACEEYVEWARPLARFWRNKIITAEFDCFVAVCILIEL